jgi:hypothetical protein
MLKHASQDVKTISTFSSVNLDFTKKNFLKVNMQHFRQVLTTFPMARSLDISFCYRINASSIPLITNLTGLETLNVAGLEWFNDETLREIAANCTSDIQNIDMVRGLSFFS